MSSNRIKKQGTPKKGTASSSKKASPSHTQTKKPKTTAKPKGTAATASRKKPAASSKTAQTASAPLKRRRPPKKRLRVGRLLVLVGICGLLLGVGVYALSASNFFPAMSSLLAGDRTAEQTPVNHSREVAAIRKLNALDTVDGVSAFSDEELRDCFYSSDIDEKIENRLKAMGYTDQIPLEDLQYVRVLFYDFDGRTEVGELVVNKDIATKVENVFYDLYTHRYPIQKMILPDAYGTQISESFSDNNTVALCFGLSEENLGDVHAEGYAIDLNPLYNPLIKDNGSTLSVFPMEGQLYLDRTIQAEHYIHKDDYAVTAFEKEGFVWKGDTEGSNDYKHFEYPHASTRHESSSQASSQKEEQEEEQPQSEPAETPAVDEPAQEPSVPADNADPVEQDPIVEDPIVENPIVENPGYQDPIETDNEQPQYPEELPEAPSEPMPDNVYGPNDLYANAPE